MTTHPITRTQRGAAALFLALAVAGLVALAPARAAAFGNDFDSDFDDDLGLTILQMQRESIASQEELAREAGRVQRRAEVQTLKEKQASEHDEYFSSILETSQAALRAPRGAYYRKPGDSTQEVPASAQALEVDGVSYLYDQGVFWIAPGPPFIAAIAPFGAEVDKLPAGSYRVVSKGAPRYYYFGVFFQEKAGKYLVTKPPAGTLVSYLPDGYRTEQAGGKTLYTFGSTHFRPVFVQGVLVYEVVEP
jgi:hypothetical protein